MLLSETFDRMEHNEFNYDWPRMSGWMILAEWKNEIIYTEIHIMAVSMQKK